ncbi:MAG: hypothetical protein HYU64_05925 [Armatimonadetes bacterium]|nr:hypothetical protein [Armatimonadota bacterium]
MDQTTIRFPALLPTARAGSSNPGLLLLTKSEASTTDVAQDVLLRGCLRGAATAADLYIAQNAVNYRWDDFSTYWASQLASAAGAIHGVVGLCNILGGFGVNLDTLIGYGSSGERNKLKVLTGFGDLLTGAGLLAQAGGGPVMLPFTLMGIGLSTIGSAATIIRDLKK